jgi:hypothetical protein
VAASAAVTPAMRVAGAVSGLASIEENVSVPTTRPASRVLPPA